MATGRSSHLGCLAAVTAAWRVGQIAKAIHVLQAREIEGCRAGLAVALMEESSISSARTSPTREWPAPSLLAIARCLSCGHSIRACLMRCRFAA
jgi:hypothetical protein